MALQSELMAKGLPAAAARALGQDAPVGNLVGAGTNQATALAITSALSGFGVVAAGTGCVLPPSGDKPLYGILNQGANALLVYPNGTEAMNGVASTAVSVPAGKTAFFLSTSLGWLANVSA